jgi:hypothetical protein
MVNLTVNVLRVRVVQVLLRDVFIKELVVQVIWAMIV